MSARRLIALGAAAALTLLSGCASAEDAGPTTLPTTASDSATSVTSESTPLTTTATSIADSSAESAPSTPATEASSGSVGPAPWPDGLSAADQTRAQAGIDAFVGYYAMADAVYSAPGAKDWTLDIYAYATGDKAASLLADAQAAAADGSHQIGTSVVTDVRVDAVAADQLTVSGCVGGDLQYVDANGTVLAHVTDSRRLTATVVTRDAGVQLVIAIADPQAAPAC